MGRYALLKSDTFKGRLLGTIGYSAAYTYTNIWVQEVQKRFWGSRFSADNLKFDNMWGLFHSTPRNLLHWWIWNGIVARPGVNPAYVAGLITGMNVLDGLQRKWWYAHAKLNYLRDDVTFFRALFSKRVDSLPKTD